MGQYYKPISIEKGEHVYSHIYGSGLKLMEHSWTNNLFVKVVETLIAEGGRWYGDHIVWAGDYADNEPGEPTNLYLKSTNDKETRPFPDEAPYYRYLVNLDTKEYVDKDKVPDVDGWQIHPLPLLTCEGNGRGGGDFHKPSELIGKWARMRVVAQNTKPDPEYTELVFDLVE